MKLSIDNIMKIAHAEIEIDGITVVAGENNTGKSTVGKVLWAVTESLYCYDEYVQEIKENNVWKSLGQLGKNLDLMCKSLSGAKRKKKAKIDRLQDCFTENILRGFEDRTLKKQVEEYRDEFVKLYGLEPSERIATETKEWVEETFHEIREIVDLADNVAGCDKVTSIFQDVFNECVIKAGTESASVEFYDEKNKCNRIHFKNKAIDECVLVEREFSSRNRTYFISGPDVLERYERFFAYGDNLQRRNRLKGFLTPGGATLFPIYDFAGNDFYVRQFAEVNEYVLKKNNISDIIEKIGEIMHGRFVIENNRMKFKDLDTGATIPVGNMSEGLKAIALLERIISYDLLSKNTVLVLDEPEINLHPEWQLAYAEIIVMLQKELQIKVVLTTHSPYFLKAIEHYAKQYEREDVCHYYCAKNKNGSAVIYNVDDMPDIIYKKLAMPLVRITDIEE